MALASSTKKFHDDAEEEGLEEGVFALPKWRMQEKSKSWYTPSCLRSRRKARSAWMHCHITCHSWYQVALLIVLVISTTVAILYTSTMAASIWRPKIQNINNGIQQMVYNWQEPDTRGAWQPQWRNDFSRGIVPKNCHSHNDYWRSVPLYEALAAGCISIEADIWVTEDEELLVSHTWRSTKKDRTLKNLYIDPLMNILEKRNVSSTFSKRREVGVFEADADVSVVLLIDFKNNGRDIWPVLVRQLKHLRERGWLSYFDGERVIKGPLTIVGTGNTPFELIQKMGSDRFIFFDAPLNDASNPAYTSSNSYYASARMRKAIGLVWFDLSVTQIDTLKSQIHVTADKHLVSRYWSTPSWPMSLRNKIWNTLMKNHVGMLNIDDLDVAKRTDWAWCAHPGLSICKSP